MAIHAAAVCTYMNIYKFSIEILKIHWADHIWIKNVEEVFVLGFYSSCFYIFRSWETLMVTVSSIIFSYNGRFGCVFFLAPLNPFSFVNRLSVFFPYWCHSAGQILWLQINDDQKKILNYQKNKTTSQPREKKDDFTTEREKNGFLFQKISSISQKPIIIAEFDISASRSSAIF